MTFLSGTKIELLDNAPNVSNATFPESCFDCDYPSLRMRPDFKEHTIWCHMAPDGVPTYSHELMNNIGMMQRNISQFYAGTMPGQQHALRWFVMASAAPGIFNLGGDLAHFADRIRRKDLAALRHYGHVAVEAIYRNTVAFDAPLVTMALVQGDALGGGFEHALSFDLIVAERSAKLGLPEILFNLFPGMGAYSFLSRRLDRARAEAMILSGRIYTGAELHEMGVVDVLAEDGEGEMTAREYIARHDPKHNAHLATYRSRRRVNPVTLSELQDVVDIWAEAAMNLSEANLRKMDRLARAQTRRVATAYESAA
ncbi:MAG: crotonase/enoyl-CoA hydratase family protein [Janthinobacterium lividum]